MKEAVIHYFSGTGNTYHMINLIGENLKAHGFSVDVNSIENGFIRSAADYELHVFSYPVYAFGTPSIVLRYIKNLKNAEGIKAAVVCTCGGNEGQSLQHIKSVLKGKGFDVFLTEAMYYPDNWTQMTNPMPEEEQAKKIAKADSKIKELSDNIAEGKRSFHFTKASTIAWSWLVFLLFSIIGRKVLGKTFVDDSTCTSCGMCQRICPVKAVKVRDGRPEWSWSCENCERCMNVCPTKSIQTSNLKLRSYIILELGFIIITAIAGSFLHIPALFCTLLYFVIIIPLHFIVDRVLTRMSKKSTSRSSIEKSITRNNRRYFLKEFKSILK